jgi:chaperonin GroEL
MTILHEYPFVKPIERLVGGIVRQTALNLHREEGDGVKTLVRLTLDIYREFIHTGVTAEDEADFLEVTNTIAEELGTPCDSTSLAYEVAMEASKGNEEIASILADAVAVIGKTGRIHFEDGVSTDCHVLMREGYLLSSGWCAQEFAKKAIERVLESPLVAVCLQDLKSFDDVKSMLETASQWPHPLLVIAPYIYGEALATLVQNDSKGTLTVVGVQAARGTLQRDLLLDIAAYAGATAADTNAGFSLKDFQGEWLGSLRKVTITSKEFVAIPFPDKADSILDRVKHLQCRADCEASPYTKDILQERIAALTESLCIVQVGGYTEAERREKRAVIETTARSLQQAVKHGVLLENPYQVMAETLPYSKLCTALAKYNSQKAVPKSVFLAITAKAFSTAKLLLNSRAWISK